MNREITEEMNWDEEKTQRGYAGNPHTILVATEADLNDHWVDLYQTEAAPDFDEFQRVFCLYFSNKNGKVIVSSVVDNKPSIEASLENGDHTIYVAGKNLGIDQLRLGEVTELSDEEYRQRHDLERYSVFLIVGKPAKEGKIREVSLNECSQ